MAVLEDLIKAFKSDEGIKGTKVAKMMSRKEAGNYTTIGSRVSNPMSNPRYNVSAIGRDKHYYLLRQYENDIAKDLVKSLSHVRKNKIKLSSKQKKNVLDNYDMLKYLQKINKASEDILIKDGKNPLDVMMKEKAKIKPSQLSSDLTEPSPDLFKDMEDLNKSMKDLDDAAKNLEESGMGLETHMQKLKKASDDLKKSIEDPFDTAGQAERKQKWKLRNEGKGFAENEAYNRALSRKLLLHLDKNGIIKLTDKVRDSLKNYDDLRGIPDPLQVPDPVRVLREHIKGAKTDDSVFDILPQGLDEYSASKPEAFKDFVKQLKTDKTQFRTGPADEMVSEPRWKIKRTVGEADEYFTPGEYHHRLLDKQDTIDLIKSGESAYKTPDSMDEAIKMYQKEYDDLVKARERVYPDYKGPFPKVDPRNTAFIVQGIDGSGNLVRVGRYTDRVKVDKETGETSHSFWDRWDEKNNKFFEKESDYKFSTAYDKTGKELDFKVIKEGDEGFDEISEKLGITARPGFPVTETGKADLKLVKASTKDEKFRAELKTKLMNLPEFKKSNMTEADMDFVLKDVRADLGMDGSYQTVMKNAKLLDEQKKKTTMDEAWKEATKDFPQSGTIDDMKKWAKDKETKLATTKKKDRPSIRLMKDFEKDLTDIDLAKEGYNLQEIDIIKRARDVMKKEGQNPDDALTWVRGEMADDAGVEIEEFMTDFDWGDFPGKDDFATGGRVGYEGGTHPLVPAELTDILQRLKMVTQGEGMYSNWSHDNRKSLQRVLTSRANALLGS